MGSASNKRRDFLRKRLPMLLKGVSLSLCEDEEDGERLIGISDFTTLISHLVSARSNSRRANTYSCSIRLNCLHLDCRASFEKWLGNLFGFDFDV